MQLIFCYNKVVKVLAFIGKHLLTLDSWAY